MGALGGIIPAEGKLPQLQVSFSRQSLSPLEQIAALKREYMALNGIIPIWGKKVSYVKGGVFSAPGWPPTEKSVYDRNRYYTIWSHILPFRVAYWPRRTSSTQESSDCIQEVFDSDGYKTLGFLKWHCLAFLW